MIYLDNAATTRVRDEVIDIMVKYLKENYGNPSSLYDFGYSVSKDINSCREVIAKYINCKAEEVFLTPVQQKEIILQFLEGFQLQKVKM